MSMGVNKVMLIGNLGQDPELRFAQSGTAVCNLSIACNERRKNGDQWNDHCEWVRVVCFGKTAENLAEYMSKGSSIFVEGRLQTSEYTDKDGVDRRSTEVIAHQIRFLGGGGGNQSQRKPVKKPAQQSQPAAQKDTRSGPINTKPADDFYDDDLPF